MCCQSLFNISFQLYSFLLRLDLARFIFSFLTLLWCNIKIYSLVLLRLSACPKNLPMCHQRVDISAPSPESCTGSWLCAHRPVTAALLCST